LFAAPLKKGNFVRLFLGNDQEREVRVVLWVVPGAKRLPLIVTNSVSPNHQGAMAEWSNA
jgi:hypothetical protein